MQDSSQSTFTELKRVTDGYNYWPWSAGKQIDYPIQLILTSVYGDEVGLNLHLLTVRLLLKFQP